MNAATNNLKVEVGTRSVSVTSFDKKSSASNGSLYCPDKNEMSSNYPKSLYVDNVKILLGRGVNLEEGDIARFIHVVDVPKQEASAEEEKQLRVFDAESDINTINFVGGMLLEVTKTKLNSLLLNFYPRPGNALGEILSVDGAILNKDFYEFEVEKSTKSI